MMATADDDDDAMMATADDDDDAMMATADDDAMADAMADDMADDDAMISTANTGDKDDDMMGTAGADEDVDAAITTLDESDAAIGPQTHEVLLPEGTSVVGCEKTDECYVPADLTVSVGDTVSWVNVDTAAHTVTSGTIEKGPDGRFDSSLLMPDKTYSFTFDAAGDYDYYCIVHPWMIGTVVVP